MYRHSFLAAALAVATLVPVSAQPTPAPSMTELLHAAPGSVYWGNARLWFFDAHSFAFLPNSDGYKSYEGTPFEIRYLDASGSEVARAALDTRPVGNGPFQNSSDTEGLNLRNTGAGDYTVEWLIDGEPFYRLPITVTAITSDDPYATGSKWAVDGPWGEFLTVKVPRGNTVSPVSLMFFDRTVGFERDRSSEIGYMVLVERDGEPVWRMPSNDWYYDRGPNFDANSGIGGMVYEATPWWNSIEVTALNYWPEANLDPNNSRQRGENIEMEDLEDGTYTVTVETFNHKDVEDNPTLSNIRGNILTTRTATFEVSDGAIVPQGRQAPGADPMTRIEGGHSDLTHMFHFIPWNG
ncbi:MAG: hypothetical protein AAGK21_00695 [Bacteroidota bacterium]